jgi:ribosomal protein S18
MISIIIPTLFKVDRIYKTLLELSECNKVGEIILIDNTTNAKDFNIPKLKYIYEGSNTYVNPAWNKGAEIASFDKLCFLSDDVWIDWKHLDYISNYITEDMGMVGMGDNFNINEESINITTIIPDPIVRNRSLSYACCFFMHKKSYVTIPNDLKIWCGDDWLFYKSKINSIINGIKCNGYVSFTADNLEYKPIFDPIKYNDMQVMKKLISDGKIDNYLVNTYWA